MSKYFAWPLMPWDLGAKWRTGDWARDAKVKEFLGLAEDQLIAGFIYVGYPEIDG